MTRGRALALAAGALALAALLSLLAVDVIHRENALDSGDVRYTAGTAADDLWAASEILPLGTARKLLGVNDDLEYRNAARLFRLGQPRVANFQFNLPPIRAEAEGALSRAATHEQDPERKSQLINLLGVLELARAAADTSQSPEVLQASAETFRSALELVLRVRRAQQQDSQQGGRPPQNASQVGLSKTGSGY
jgi:hypothetical protein